MSATIPNDVTSPGEPVTDERKTEAQSEAPAEPRIPREHAERFYDRLRHRIHAYVAKKGRFAERSTEFLLLVPDMFILLWRLTTDSRVNGKNKILLGTGIAYFVSPIDVLPEEFLGPVGYVDDLVFAAYILNKILSDTDPQVLRDHWSGEADVLASIQKVLGAADSLLGKRANKKMNRDT